jgi:opacity protein-like surface antigen
MSRFKVSAAIGLLAAQVLAAQVGPTMAADMPGTLPPPGMPLPMVERSPPRFFDGSGWYLRGDLGYAWGAVDSAQSAAPFANPTDSKLGSAATGGLGAGIKTRWLRTDVTFDYMAEAKYQGTIAAPNDVTAKISNWTALFNGYLLSPVAIYRRRPRRRDGACHRIPEYGGAAFRLRPVEQQMEFRLGRDGRRRLPAVAEHDCRCRLPLPQFRRRQNRRRQLRRHDIQESRRA